MKSVIVGTAGHIDHGKTALVKALTGIDADRLEEEKRRGITIDIGFAHLELPGPGGEKLRLGFVDVPGHERFVRNMLAGVGGIDLVLLVIAADESIKPQTREHFDICRLLAVCRGITVLTKSDLVDQDTLEVVRLEVEDFLRGSFLDAATSPIVPVSSITGAGLGELKQAIVKVASEVPAKDSTALARLPIDRVFTMKGFGTVVTGTLISGTIRKEEELEVFPSGKRVRVRGVQVHGSPAEQAVAGERTALNLAGVATEDLARGMMLAPPDTFRSTDRIDVSLALLPSARPLREGARVHLHAYTSETVAEVRLYGSKRVEPGQTAHAQLRMDNPALFLPGDRFIFRQFSPVVTIGGGVVVDALPMHTPRQIRGMEKIAKGEIRAFPALRDILASGRKHLVFQSRVVRRGATGLSQPDAVAETGWRANEIDAIGQELVGSGSLVRFADRWFAEEEFELAQESLLGAVTEFHKANALVPGIGRRELQEHLRFLKIAPELFIAALSHLATTNNLELSGDIVRLRGRGVIMKDEEAESKKIIEDAFASAGLKVPFLRDVLAGLKVDKIRAQKIVTLLLRDKVLIKLSDELVFHRTALEELRRQMAAYKAKSPKIDVGKFKDITGVSRKYAIPLLEYLDRERVTRRVGDERVIL